MKKLLACIVLTTGILISNIVYSSNVQVGDKYYISNPLINITMASITSSYGKYEFAFENLLDQDERTYKQNSIIFNIDGILHPLTFDLYIKLSNKGVEEKAIVSVSRSLLTKIANSKTTLIKIGGTRTTQIDSEYKDLIADLLVKTK